MRTSYTAKETSRHFRVYTAEKVFRTYSSFRFKITVKYSRVGSANPVLEVKEQNGKKVSAKKTSSSSQEKKLEEKEEFEKGTHQCDECKWYDVSTQRDFFRKVGPRDESGQRTTIKEIRAICRSPKSKAKGHLVKNDSDRPCFERGVYTSAKEEKMTSPEEYFGTPEGRLKEKSKRKELKWGARQSRKK